MRFRFLRKSQNLGTRGSPDTRARCMYPEMYATGRNGTRMVTGLAGVTVNTGQLSPRAEVKVSHTRERTLIMRRTGLLF